MDLKPLVTLLAIVNPLAIVPFFIHYTQGFSGAQRRNTIWVSSFSAFVVIAVSALLGLQILEFFGISLASFQVGGGMLLLISPPGYGKTTLMEYVADRLGLIFVRINCPALGHSMTSLDPSTAPNSAARQELEKLNLGNNAELTVYAIRNGLV